MKKHLGTFVYIVLAGMLINATIPEQHYVFKNSFFVFSIPIALLIYYWNTLKSKLKDGIFEVLAWGIVILSLTVTAFIRWVLYYDPINSPDVSMIDLGTIGDFLGGTTAPLLNFASFLLLYSALVVQRKELEAQRKELELTRDAMNDQSKVLTQQRFEVTFFNMLGRLDQVKKNTNYDFRNEYNTLQNFIFNKKKMGVFTNREGLIVSVVCRTQLSEYYDYIYCIFQLVINSKFDDKQEEYYLEVLFAQLTHAEKCHIYYEALSRSDFTQHFDICKKVRITRYINVTELVDPEDLEFVLNDRPLVEFQEAMEEYLEEQYS